jgi:hypothetical protein
MTTTTGPAMAVRSTSLQPGHLGPAHPPLEEMVTNAYEAVPEAREVEP